MTGPRRVLLVEDHEPIREAYSLLLEDSGFSVSAAGRGDDALRLAAAHPPRLILLDLGLPDMAGLDLVRALRAAPGTAGVPVVALTGRALDEDRDAALAAGCTAYLVKPVETRVLLRTVADLVGA